MTQTVWLVSYPKSGNTWVRAFLSAYDRGCFDRFSELFPDHAADRQWFHDATGVESTDMVSDEVSRLRPFQLFDRVGVPRVVKMHDAFLPSMLPAGPHHTLPRVIYLIRHPLDVAVSWAHHNKIPIEESVSFLQDADAMLGDDRRGPGHQLPQALGTWHSHVESWVCSSHLNPVVVRYEDLLDDPLVWFQVIAEASGRAVDYDRLRRAVDAVRLDRLRALEAKDGFPEGAVATKFFRLGEAGTWKRCIPSLEARKFFEVNRLMMANYGYGEIFPPIT